MKNTERHTLRWYKESMYGYIQQCDIIVDEINKIIIKEKLNK